MEHRVWLCGARIATGVKIVALINLLYSLGLIIAELVLYFQSGLEGIGELNAEFSGSSLEQISNSKQKRSIDLIENDVHVPTTIGTKTVLSIPVLQFVVSIIWILTWILSIIFSLLLYRAAVVRNIRFAEIWFYYRIVTLVFRIIFLAIYLVAGFSMLPKIPILIQFAIGIYSLWLVNAFINELKQEKLDAIQEKNKMQIPSFTFDPPEGAN